MKIVLDTNVLVAVKGQVACLVTGNQVHFPTHLCQGVKVLSPADFLTFYRATS